MLDTCQAIALQRYKQGRGVFKAQNEHALLYDLSWRDQFHLSSGCVWRRHIYFSRVHFSL